MRKLDEKAALVLFSGGQDSSTTLAWALEKFERVETIGFDYGQRHAVELTARLNVRDAMASMRADWAGRLGRDEVVDLKGLGEISDTAMTRESEIYIAENGLPTTFVPGRNLVFLTMAAAAAYRRDLGALVAGMCETDFSGYPDCRQETLEAQLRAINLGLDAAFRLKTPLMHLTKAQSWILAESIGGAELVEIILELSHTCYRGERGERFDWGFGCNACPACELRAKGWSDFRAAKDRGN
ncbi:MAG: 7-cyano-7-deazaguanine synthase QueC [Parvularculaceae bacterium]|nr:7-cyano-7-deazaguanine synthase QueC [Parvularculaceae bacterium]